MSSPYWIPIAFFVNTEVIFQMDDVHSFVLLCKAIIQNIDQIIKDPTWNAILMSPRVPENSLNLEFQPVMYFLFPQAIFFPFI